MVYHPQIVTHAGNYPDLTYVGLQQLRWLITIRHRYGTPPAIGTVKRTVVA